MTYCVAIKVETGLVMASDSRTNAGIDNISTFCKMSTFSAPDRMIVILSAGNLATTQSVISLLQQRLTQDTINLYNVRSLYDSACLVGQTLREVMIRHNQREAMDTGIDYGSSLLLGGQIQGEPHRLFNIYPQGNFIEATDDSPYFQIGEFKYGKPIIDRVIKSNSGLMQAAKCVLVSFDSTIRSSLFVGLPIDIILYQRNQFHPTFQYRFVEGDPYLVQLSELWSQGLKNLFSRIPDPPWGL